MNIFTVVTGVPHFPFPLTERTMTFGAPWTNELGWSFKLPSFAAQHDQQRGPRNGVTDEYPDNHVNHLRPATRR
tara:strand:+ start:302 stop:523 length:222 start_codon:yes stop_codon:yes gene_type:complete